MFKDKLKQLRIQKGVTQADIATAIGVSPATIGNYEQGTREPRNNEMWKKIADFFGVSVDYLMDKTETSYASLRSRILPLEETESPKKNPFKQFRTDIPIIYNNVDITKFVFSTPGETMSVTREQQYAYVEFNSRSGHVLFARINLLDILNELKILNINEISANLKDIVNRIEWDVVNWYKRCWNNIDDLFPKVTDLKTLFDLLDKCLSVDMIATQEFYLENIDENFDWLRRKLH